MIKFSYCTCWLLGWLQLTWQYLIASCWLYYCTCSNMDKDQQEHAGSGQPRRCPVGHPVEVSVVQNQDQQQRAESAASNMDPEDRHERRRPRMGIPKDQRVGEKEEQPREVKRLPPRAFFRASPHDAARHGGATGPDHGHDARCQPYATPDLRHLLWCTPAVQDKDTFRARVAEFISKLKDGGPMTPVGHAQAHFRLHWLLHGRQYQPPQGRRKLGRAAPQLRRRLPSPQDRHRCLLLLRRRRGLERVGHLGVRIWTLAANHESKSESPSLVPRLLMVNLVAFKYMHWY